VSILTIMLSLIASMHGQAVYGLVLATIFSRSQPLRPLFVEESERQCVQKQLHTVDELKKCIPFVTIRITADSKQSSCQRSASAANGLGGSHTGDFFSPSSLSHMAPK
jgi:hypothetical protein